MSKDIPSSPSGMQATVRESTLLDALDRWRDTAVSEIDDIDAWCECPGEKQWHSEWKYPDSFGGDTQYIAVHGPAHFATIDQVAIDQVVQAVERWHRTHSTDGLPDQVTLHLMLDRAVMSVIRIRETIMRQIGERRADADQALIADDAADDPKAKWQHFIDKTGPVKYSDYWYCLRKDAWSIPEGACTVLGYPSGVNPSWVNLRDNATYQAGVDSRIHSIIHHADRAILGGKLQAKEHGGEFYVVPAEFVTWYASYRQTPQGPKPLCTDELPEGLQAELDRLGWTKPEAAAAGPDTGTPASTKKQSGRTSKASKERVSGIAARMGVRAWEGFTFEVDNDLVIIRSGKHREDYTYDKLGMGRGKRKDTLNKAKRLLVFLATGTYSSDTDSAYTGEGGRKVLSLDLTRLNEKLKHAFGLKENPVYLKDNFVKTKFRIRETGADNLDDTGRVHAPKDKAAAALRAKRFTTLKEAERLSADQKVRRT